MALNTEKIRNPELRKYADEHFNHAARLVAMGAPILADDNRVVTVANMKVGAYVIAAQPDVTRNLTLTHVTVVAGTDTLGTVVVVGTDVLGHSITETFTPVADSVVTGVKAFKTITSITGVGWVTAGGADTIIVGVGNKLGSPVLMDGVTRAPIGMLGTALITPTVSSVDKIISECTIDLSSGTYDGTKIAMAFIVE